MTEAPHGEHDDLSPLWTFTGGPDPDLALQLVASLEPDEVDTNLLVASGLVASPVRRFASWSLVLGALVAAGILLV